MDINSSNQALGATYQLDLCDGYILIQLSNKIHKKKVTLSCYCHAGAKGKRYIAPTHP
jgi:hypothetical protein